jgi:putative acetyltransferase
MNPHSLRIEVVDPQGADALVLLREAAIEARALYPDLHAPDAPFPDNPPTPPRGIYLLAYEGKLPIASGALRPINETTVEIRRMYVLKEYRRHGVARSMLAALERESARLGYNLMRLETGYKQDSAMRLYEAYGFIRIPPFGVYIDDPSSVCFEKPVETGPKDT